METETCCESYRRAIAHHLHGEQNWPSAIHRYKRALSGHHSFAARQFLGWIDRKLPVVPFHECVISEMFPHSLVSKESLDRLRDCIARAETREEFGAAHRSLTLLWSLSSAAPVALRAEWHKLKMRNDIKMVGSTDAEFQKSFRNIGINHNLLDDQGIPRPGLVRQKSKLDPSGWLSVDRIDFKNGKMSVIGESSDHIPPFVTQEDIDVISRLVFIDKTSPSFSLDATDLMIGPTKLNIKVFQPRWISQTQFGQALFYADWMMKALTSSNGHGIPSLTDPYSSSCMSSRWTAPAFLKHLQLVMGDAADGDVLEDGSRTDAARFQIFGDGVKLTRAHYKTFFGSDIYEYQIDEIHTFIDSSLYNYEPDGTTTHFRYRDEQTSVGAFASALTQHYNYAGNLFPVFRRVELLLGLYNVLRQAYDDGVRLSAQELARVRDATVKFQPAPSHKFATEYAPRTYHANGCLCTGGVGVNQNNEVKPFRNGPLPKRESGVNFIVSPNGFTSPVPHGAVGPEPVDTGRGFRFSGGSGGFGFSEQTAQVWIMDTTIRQGARTYYKNMMGKDGQKVDPFTGKPIDQKNPMAHIYHEKSGP